MKKYVKLICAVLMVALCVAVFAACGKSYAGTYKFDSMTMSYGGATVSYKVGEAMEGLSITEDFCVLELKDDGTWEMSMKIEETKEKGTWTEESGKIILKSTEHGGETITATLDGNKLTMAQDMGENSVGGSASIVLIKK